MHVEFTYEKPKKPMLETVTLTLTKEEALVLHTIAFYTETIPQAMYPSGCFFNAPSREYRAVERVLVNLRSVLANVV